MIRWTPFLGFTVFLYVTYTLPPDQIPKAVLEANDKLLHFLDFLILTLLAFRSFFYSSSTFFSIKAGGKAFLFSAAYGAFLEGIQSRIGFREGNPLDWLADLAGCVLAYVIARRC